MTRTLSTATKHIIFWICYFVFCFASDLVFDPNSTLIAEVTFYLSQNIFLFYSLYFFLRKFSSKTKIEFFVSMARLVVILSVYFTMRYVLRYHFLGIYVDPEFAILPIREWVVHGILWVVNYFFIASAYFYFTSSLAQQKILRLMAEERTQNIKDHLELENALLRAQINPHFLYNSLNFLYAKSLPISQELSNAIMRLSEIMRYSLQTQESDGLVALSDEVAHIKNLVEMARLRYNNRIFLNLSITEGINGEKIIPLVFVTLVENVLKHGTLSNEAHPATVKMELSNEGILHFSTWNLKRVGPKESSTGIGLKNAVQRLEETYGNRCDISILEDDNSFQTSIKVPLELHLTLK